MATPTKKITRKKPKNVLMIAVVLLLVAVLAVQLFYPAKLENGKLKRLGGGSSSPAPAKAPAPVPEAQENTETTEVNNDPVVG
ncbi:hypothetical protein [Brumimicrobium aurantiacum]|uniref:Uncharacterized protein n=1 Tax=Brumimicrobium aurantiacum TaxID=1737063 RepID=A0A3E1EZ81_9FLAO|nr:hypothetical protein [Brumimicrobium aurantiacum]RFC54858.1 hypothetical protein DXU93_03290 [Brumimicrobium aurantiacum]